jgi:nitroreductase
MDRIADHPIESMFVKRWSPRAMDGQPVSSQDLMVLFEAARWAPSSGNVQPWRFIYAQAGTSAFSSLYELLAEGNKSWCVRAGALVVVISKKVLDNGKPAVTHSFDSGAAWMCLALQASTMGIIAHGMQGFDYERARNELQIPSEYAVEAMIALGYPGQVEDLVEKDRAREAPSGRRPVSESVFEGKFQAR